MDIITSRNNTKIQRTVKLKQKKYRDDASLFCFEGIKLYKEAKAAGVRFTDVFVTERALGRLEQENAPFDFPVTLVTDAVFEKLTHEQAPEGVFCVAQKWVCPPPAQPTKLIVCSVRDPGNLGTIIRSALAFNLGELILSADCPDIFSYKVIRASMGACFKQSIKIINNLYTQIDNLKKCGYNLFAATLSADSLPVDQISIDRQCCFVIGNEGHGLPEDVIAACGSKAVIPIAPGAESLNASIAASIFMWEIQRKSHDD